MPFSSKVMLELQHTLDLWQRAYSDMHCHLVAALTSRFSRGGLFIAPAAVGCKRC